MIRDKVLTSRGNASRITTNDLDLPSSAEINRIAIYSHLTLRLQELLHSAKAHAPKHIQLQVVLGERRSNLPTQNGYFYGDSPGVD